MFHVKQAGLLRVRPLLQGPTGLFHVKRHVRSHVQPLRMG